MAEPPHPRVAMLLARFREIDADMRPLPLYNPALVVAAVSFRRLPGEGRIGVLLTPWFMNMTILPEAEEPVDPARHGEGRGVDLPAGMRGFRYNGDPAIGAFRGHSLHSPMEAFQTRARALSAAEAALTSAMTPPEEAHRQAEAAAADPSAPPAARALSRREILRGRGG